MAKTYTLEHYRDPKCSNPIIKMAPPALAFTRLVDELHPAIRDALTQGGAKPKENFYRADYPIFSGERKGKPTVVDFVGFKIDTKKLLRMSLQTTHAGKEELKALAKKIGVEWKEIDHTVDEMNRIKLQRNFRVVVIRFPISEPIDKAAVTALVHCALKHLPDIDEATKDPSKHVERGWYHGV